jgi:hypothetical protein
MLLRLPLIIPPSPPVQLLPYPFGQVVIGDKLTPFFKRSPDKTIIQFIKRRGTLKAPLRQELSLPREASQLKAAVVIAFIERL